MGWPAYAMGSLVCSPFMWRVFAELNFNIVLTTSASRSSRIRIHHPHYEYIVCTRRVCDSEMYTASHKDRINGCDICVCTVEHNLRTNTEKAIKIAAPFSGSAHILKMDESCGVAI